MKKKLTTLLGLLFLIAGLQFVMAPQSSLIGQTYRILVRRGLAADLPALTAGEFGFTTDTKALYLGSSAGNLAIGGTGAEVRTAKFTVGDNAVVQGGDFRAGNDWTTEAGWHSFEAEPLIENHGGHGFAAYDSRPTMQGTGPYDHFVGFQSRPIYNSSGNLASYMAAFDTFPVHGGAGTVANGYGLLVRDFGGVGPITTDYGIYINEIWRGDRWQQFRKRMIVHDSNGQRSGEIFNGALESMRVVADIENWDYCRTCLHKWGKSC